MTDTQFKRLFEPFNIGTLQLKNRIVMPPMGTGYAEDEGYIGQRLIDYYEARARGGAGLVIVEFTAPDLQCKRDRQLVLGDGRYAAGWKNLVEAIHRHGAKAAVQLVHSGWEFRSGEPVQVAPSPIIALTRAVGFGGKVPHALSVEEVEQVAGWFVNAAKQAKEVGFDGVEIHGAHQYLVASFMSSETNQREDKYGGSPEKKARLMVEILQGIRQALGPDYPVWPRINGQEYGLERGTAIEETCQVAPLLVEAGAQAIHVSAYAAGSHVTKAPISETPGFLAPLAEQVKKVVDVPVIAVGRLGPRIGTQVLEMGQADLIAIGRRLIADPELPNKTAEGRLEDIIPCIGCMDCIERPQTEESGMACAVNPLTGREREYRIQPSDAPKKVVVAGGGPAGMQAARVAALRGHQVTLLERSSRLGGQLNIAALPLYKADILNWIDFMSRELDKAGVDVRLNAEASPDLIMGLEPDAVIVAVGGVPVKPDIPGIERARVVFAQDVLRGLAEVAANAVIVGGGMVGCETGRYLSEMNKRVTIIELLPRIASDTPPMSRRRLMDSLRKNQVTMLTNVTCRAVTDVGVTIAGADGSEETIPADSVVLAVGYRPNEDLFKALEGRGPDVYRVGDASQPRRIREANNDGYKAGLAV